MFEILKSIPINIWSVALGSLIAFSGILISNWNHTKRLKIQLKHDAELKVIERKAIMRRDVYLSAVEELVRANSYLGSLAQLDLTKTNISEGLQGFFVSSAKLGLVAEEDTSKALNELVVAYSCLLFKLMAKIMPISDLKSNIEITNHHYDDAQSEIKRILAEMTSQNETGIPDEHVFSALKSSFDFQQKKSKELADEINNCWNKVNEYTKEFALLITQEMKAIALLQAPVMVGIRKELDIDTNLETYRELVMGSAEQIEKQLDGFIASIENEA